MRAETRKVVVAIVVVAVVVAKSFQILFRTKEEYCSNPLSDTFGGEIDFLSSTVEL